MKLLFLFLLVFLVATLLWLLGSFLYKPIGKLAQRLITDAKDAMTEESDVSELMDDSEFKKQRRM